VKEKGAPDGRSSTALVCPEIAGGAVLRQLARDHPIDAGEHFFQQSFGRSCGDPRPLKLTYFAALPVNLSPHTLDFGANLVKLHGALVRL
jgi:hypothetical protein